VIPFSRDGSTVTARLTGNEAATLAVLTAQLIELLDERSVGTRTEFDTEFGIGGTTTRPQDPALARLLPDAYRDDEEAASEHRRLTELGLIDRKAANARALIASLESALPSVSGDSLLLSLDESHVHAWLRTLTDLRLAIAARLHIEQDGDAGVGDDATLGVYDWLGYLQGSLVAVVDASGAAGRS
jgi:hypothetical protein